MRAGRVCRARALVTYPKTLRHAPPRRCRRGGRDFAVSCELARLDSYSPARDCAWTSLTFCARTSFNYLIFNRRAIARRPVGQGRLELPTPRLSSACSNQLSYWPANPIWVLQPMIGPSRPNSGDSREREIDRNGPDRSLGLHSRKEVIQPQVPLRLPCYDFTPVTSHSLGGYLTRLAHRLLEQLTPMV